MKLNILDLQCTGLPMFGNLTSRGHNTVYEVISYIEQSLQK